MFKVVVGLALVGSVTTAAGFFSMMLGLGQQGAILMIGMGWAVVLLLILGLIGHTLHPPSHS
jgi:hypothetical protein